MSRDPQMAAILAEIRAAPAIDLKTMPIAQARRVSDAGSMVWSAGVPTVAARDLTIETGAARLRARLYGAGDQPPDRLAIFVHGGGWTFGSIETHDGTMRALAVALGHPVLGVDYRLAPEHPFPIPLDDTLAAIDFVEQGGLGRTVSAGRIALAGDSAGANLALGALLARRDAGRPPLGGAALYYGCYAPDFETASHRRLGGGDYLLTTVNMRWYWANFLATTPPDTSLAAPLHADLHDLPPLYLAAAGLDPLLDDTLRLADRLGQAGVAFRLDHAPDLVHGALRMSRRLDAAQRLIEAGGAFLARCLAAA